MKVEGFIKISIKLLPKLSPQSFFCVIGRPYEGSVFKGKQYFILSNAKKPRANCLVCTNDREIRKVEKLDRKSYKLVLLNKSKEGNLPVILHKTEVKDYIMGVVVKVFSDVC